MAASPSSVISPPEPAQSAPSAPATGEPIWHLYAVLFASLCVIVGGLWDISWHQSVGRDSFFTEAHLAIYLGGIVAGFACGFIALQTTFGEAAPLRPHSVTFWKYFKAPLGAWMAIWGSFAMIVSGPFDDWWHAAYGLDVEILSPPHVVLAVGIVAIQLGALLMLMARQNRPGDTAAATYRWLVALAGGLLLVMVATVLTEYTTPNTWHSAGVYKVIAIAMPFLLVAVGRAGKLRWPATAMAVFYFMAVMLMGWILQAFSAEPLLAPIMRPVENMLAPQPPLMLIPAGLAIDWMMQRWSRSWSDWLLAPVLGITFMAVAIATHWFWGIFMLSPLSRNYVFFGDQWSYQSTPGAWQYEFWGAEVDPVFATGSLLMIVALATASTRVGLWWGDWMRSVRR